MKKCPYCAEEIQDDAIYCRYCHHDLPKEEPKKKCPYCAEEIPESSEVCPVCGHELIEKAEETEDHGMITGEKVSAVGFTVVEQQEHKTVPKIKVEGLINGNTIDFNPTVYIEGKPYGSYTFEHNTGDIDSRDKKIATRFALEQLFRANGFSRIRTDGQNAELSEQLYSKYEDYIFWTFALPGMRFYPTEDDIINDRKVTVEIDGVEQRVSPLEIIKDNSSAETVGLQGIIADEKSDRINELKKYRTVPQDNIKKVQHTKPTNEKALPEAVNKKSHKGLKIALIILAVLLVLVGLLIVVPIIIGYNSPYTGIAEDDYYDLEYRRDHSGMAAFMYLSDLDLASDDMISVCLYSDGTGVFSQTLNYKTAEKGSFKMYSNCVECKYDSGKSVTFDSLEESEDKTVIHFKVLTGGKLKSYRCYLDFATDPDGNKVDGISYKEMHGSKISNSDSAKASETRTTTTAPKTTTTAATTTSATIDEKPVAVKDRGELHDEYRDPTGILLWLEPEEYIVKDIGEPDSISEVTAEDVQRYKEYDITIEEGYNYYYYGTSFNKDSAVFNTIPCLSQSLFISKERGLTQISYSIKEDYDEVCKQLNALYGNPTVDNYGKGPAASEPSTQRIWKCDYYDIEVNFGYGEEITWTYLTYTYNG